MSTEKSWLGIDISKRERENWDEKKDDRDEDR